MNSTDVSKYEKLERSYDLLKLRLESQNQELIKVNNRLRRSNEELKDFAFIISHDLKEPLRTLTEYCFLLSRQYKKKLDKKGKKFIEYIVSGSKRMMELVTDLYKFSTAIEERPSKCTSSRKCYIRAMNNMISKIKQTGATVTQGELPQVIAEEAHLIQIYQNLISNALKFRGDKALLIHVKGERVGKQGLFSVQDNGIGISPADCKNIFNIFVRVGSQPGTGIGLAICKKVIEQHGGKIWVESTLGEGSTFYFSLPLPEHEIQSINGT